MKRNGTAFRYIFNTRIERVWDKNSTLFYYLMNF